MAVTVDGSPLAHTFEPAIVQRLTSVMHIRRVGITDARTGLEGRGGFRHRELTSRGQLTGT